MIRAKSIITELAQLLGEVVLFLRVVKNTGLRADGKLLVTVTQLQSYKVAHQVFECGT